MSKLPKAPLLEVIFEIRWDITSQNDIVDFQFIYGDLYANLKHKYPYRENLVPPEVPYDVVRGLPVFRFRNTNNSYPLIQVGPGLITVNTTDDIYFWNEFSAEISDVLDIFNNIYPKYKELKLSPALTYIDFFEYNKDKITSIDFINTNLQFNISQSFVNDTNFELNDLNFTLNYKTNKDILSLNIRDGKINDEIEGIVMQTKLIGNKGLYNKNELTNWLESSHNTCSDIFKKLTEGNLYNSFK